MRGLKNINGGLRNSVPRGPPRGKARGGQTNENMRDYGPGRYNVINGQGYFNNFEKNRENEGKFKNLEKISK